MVDESAAQPEVFEGGSPTKVKKYPLLLADFNDKLVEYGWHSSSSNSAVHAVFENELAVGGRFMSVYVSLSLSLSLSLIHPLLSIFRDIDINSKEAAQGLVILQAAARMAIGPPMDIEPESICGSLLQK